VVVTCSCAPYAIDISGIIHLSNALTRVEERLSKLACDCYFVALWEVAENAFVRVLLPTQKG
jgi:hypothetical protein